MKNTRYDRHLVDLIRVTGALHAYIRPAHAGEPERVHVIDPSAHPGVAFMCGERAREGDRRRITDVATAHELDRTTGRCEYCMVELTRRTIREDATLRCVEHHEWPGQLHTRMVVAVTALEATSGYLIVRRADDHDTDPDTYTITPKWFEPAPRVGTCHACKRACYLGDELLYGSCEGTPETGPYALVWHAEHAQQDVPDPPDECDRCGHMLVDDAPTHTVRRRNDNAEVCTLCKEQLAQLADDEEPDTADWYLDYCMDADAADFEPERLHDIDDPEPDLTPAERIAEHTGRRELAP